MLDISLRASQRYTLLNMNNKIENSEKQLKRIKMTSIYFIYLTIMYILNSFISLGSQKAYL